MKSIITTTEVMGPFNSVITLSNGYIADDTFYPFSALGNTHSVGNWVPLPPHMPTQLEYTTAIDTLLDTTAQEYHYDNIINACGYAAAPNPFQAESAKFVSWRGNVWATSYMLMAQVNAGTIPQPTVAELIAMLPTL